MEIPVVARPAKGSAFWGHLEKILPIEGDALDLGTGTGRVALHVAPQVRRVVGIDASSLEAARWDAKRRGVANVAFVEGDAETADLLSLNEGRVFGLVTARLFLSRTLVPRACAVLGPGGHLVVEALESNHWVEAGGSRFNLSAPDVVADVGASGLVVEDIRIERERHEFEDAREAEEFVKERRLWTKWRRDGRWQGLRASVRSGDAGLTESYFVLCARRPSG